MGAEGACGLREGAGRAQRAGAGWQRGERAGARTLGLKDAVALGCRAPNCRPSSSSSA